MLISQKTHIASNNSRQTAVANVREICVFFLADAELFPADELFWGRSSCNATTLLVTLSFKNSSYRRASPVKLSMRPAQREAKLAICVSINSKFMEVDGGWRQFPYMKSILACHSGGRIVGCSNLGAITLILLLRSSRTPVCLDSYRALVTRV